MEDLESHFRGKPIQERRITLAPLRRAGAARLKRVGQWRRWFVRGAIIGAAWAVLFTPLSGAETRQALGRLVRPLALTGTSLLAWLLRQQHARIAKRAARRAPGRVGEAPEGWRATQGLAETSRAGAAREDVERAAARSS
jgi:hypothetical protein